MSKADFGKDTTIRIEEFIKTLSEEELLLVNRMVIERLKLLSQRKTTDEMTRFTVGDRVSFVDRRGNVISGKVIKMNKNTVSVISTDNIQWNVHPTLLRLNE